ncbi:MAG TPA: MoxR family ATPase [Tepiditoga sp.]|nr:MoxR family ATPase [Thermotogota bacterium]HOO75285.1 MoxR family ATPase [Tepiditoga sp.]
MQQITKKLSEKIVSNVSQVIKGKDEKIKIVLATFFSGGHILLEDVPGTGKTMLSRALAVSMGLDFKRIQFTPDLLPSDLTGLYIYDKNKDTFDLKKGPVFTDILLGDEINRATPRTQSALLEAMAEKQISIDGITHKLGNEFFVIATQNPVEYEGTFPLPEAQLDRFSVKLSIGYANSAEEIKMLSSQQKSHPIDSIKPVAEKEEIKKAFDEIKNVTVSDNIKEYIVNIVNETRDHKDILVGASPRGSINLMNLSRAVAAMEGRDFVIPDDIKELSEYVLGHRIMLTAEARLKRVNVSETVKRILHNVKVVV